MSEWKEKRKQYCEQFAETKSAIQYWVRSKLELGCENEDLIVWNIRFELGHITFDLGFNPDKILRGDISLKQEVLTRLLSLFGDIHSDLKLKGSEDALFLFEIRVGVDEYFSRWENPQPKEED